MRVLHYLWNASIGGIERVVLELAAEQRCSEAVEPIVLLGRAEGELLEEYRRRVPCADAGLRGGGDLSLQRLRPLVACMREADLLHLHSFHPLVAAAAIRSGRPIVFTEHGVFGRGRKGRIRERMKRMLKGRFLGTAVSVVTFNSVHAQETARRLYGIALVAQEVVPNGTPAVRSEPPGEPDPEVAARCRGRFVVGTSSRLSPGKRIDRLIDAFADLPDREGALLLLVGDSAHRTVLEERTREHGLGDAALFAGWRANARAYQALMDVCVFPSESEAFGLGAVETLALGKPTIVFRDGGGMVDIVSPLEPRDVVASVPELAERLRAYREDPRADRAPERRRYVAERFDIGAMAARFGAVYRRVLPARSDARPA